MYNCIFIRVILDFYINHILGISISNWENNIAYHITLVIIWLFLLIADYYDLKFGIIPNRLSLALVIYGFFFNVFLSIMLNCPYILLFSIALAAFVALISFILWHIGFWGGGDLKLFIALSLTLSFLDFDYLNYFNVSNVKYSLADLNIPIFNQLIFYPKVFSILLNGILISFIFLSIFLIYNIAKDKKLKYYSALSILDFKLFINQLSTKSVHIDNLSEGMVLDKYYFSDSAVFDMISNDENSNLHSHEDEGEYYFSSLNNIGLSRNDIDLIKELYKRNLIENPNFQIKKGIPFLPFLTLGYLSFFVFGDLIAIISSFIKLMF